MPQQPNPERLSPRAVPARERRLRLTRPRPKLRPEIDGFLQVECRHILTGHADCVDQPAGEPVRDRLPRGDLADVDVIGQSSETVDDLTEANNLGTRTASRPDSRLGFGIDLRVGPLTNHPDLTDLDRFVVGDPVDDSPGVPADDKFAESGRFPTERITGLGVLQQQKDLFQDLGYYDMKCSRHSPQSLRVCGQCNGIRDRPGVGYRTARSCGLTGTRHPPVSPVLCPPGMDRMSPVIKMTENGVTRDRPQPFSLAIASRTAGTISPAQRPRVTRSWAP